MDSVFLFPGQGSQTVGMGADLFDRYPEYEHRASSALGYSLRDVCLHDPAGRLSSTEYTQPALFTVSYLQFLARSEAGESAAVLAGHSLGEYVALCAAGVFDFDAGLR